MSIKLNCHFFNKQLENWHANFSQCISASIEELVCFSGYFCMNSFLQFYALSIPHRSDDYSTLSKMNISHFHRGRVLQKLHFRKKRFHNDYQNLLLGARFSGPCILQEEKKQFAKFQKYQKHFFSHKDEYLVTKVVIHIKIYEMLI